MVQPVVGSAVWFGVSPAVRDLPAETAIPGGPDRVQTVQPGEFRRTSVGTSDTDGAEEVLMPPMLIPNPTLTFDGLAATDNIAAYGSTVAPPDTTGDVGPNHYVQFVNLLFRVFDKNGNPLTGPTKMSSLFTSGLCSTNNNGDIQVLWDPMADRWLLAQFAFTAINAPPYHMCVAVSKTPDPTGAYNVYDFVTPGNEFPDYPKFGVWPDGYYMTVNQFTNGGPFNGTGAYAFDRAKMLAGLPATFIYFNLNLASHPEGIGGALPADLDGMNVPPVGARNTFTYFLATEFFDALDGLRLFDFHADFAVPANSTFTERPESPVVTAAFNPVVSGIPQLGTTSLLATLADRLMHRQQYRNFLTKECLTNNHTVVGGAAQAAIRWHILCKTGSTYSLADEGTFAPDSLHRWMGSVALDRDGNLAVGYSVSSSAIFPQIWYAGRLATDPPGQLAQGEHLMFFGTGSQVGTNGRWGDYSSMTVDPTDDCTFWYTTEYYTITSSFNWRTGIGNFKFPSCGGGGGQPDLVVTALTNPPGTAARGTKFSVTDTTTNQGTGSTGDQDAPLPGTSRTRYYLSLDAIKNAGDKRLKGAHVVPALAAGAEHTKTRNVTIPLNTAPNTYFMLACADDTKKVPESNENNNCRSSTGQITVTP
jgi:hypothetical protein